MLLARAFPVASPDGTPKKPKAPSALPAEATAAARRTPAEGTAVRRKLRGWSGAGMSPAPKSQAAATAASGSADLPFRVQPAKGKRTTAQKITGAQL